MIGVIAQRLHADDALEKLYAVGYSQATVLEVILAIGMKEVEEHTVSVRRLGEKQTSVQPLHDVVNGLAQEATPPDLR